MHLSPSRQAFSSPDTDDSYLSPTTVDELAKACQATSKTLQSRLSISSHSSDPGMMFDPSNSSSSDTSFEDSLTRDPSEADLAALQIENETWDLYWTPIKESLLPQDPILSPWNRNFASSNLCSLNISENNRNLKRRSEVHRAPRRLNHSSPPALPPLQRTTYSACPNCTLSTPPTVNTSRSPPILQSNDHPTDPQHMRPLPSPFLELEKRGGGAELGMDIDVGNETSVWEEDDADEGMGALVVSLRSRLHIRSSSAQGESGGELGVKVRQGKRMKRSLSEVVKGVFRVRRKGGTL